MEKVSSWGRLSHLNHKVYHLHRENPMMSLMPEKLTGICYGMGRSYGDVCLNPEGSLWKTRYLDHLISFDENTGRLICEAGVLIKDIQQLFIPRGWCLSVTPGTQMVTIGGAIANDVHGKNYHRFGSFGNHVKGIDLLRTNGERIQCGPNTRPDWFAATIGGLGLTGIILSADIQLSRIGGPWLQIESIPYSRLDTFFELADHSEEGWEHTVSWVDCLNAKSQRGIFLRANSVQPCEEQRLFLQKKRVGSKRQKKIVMTPPFSLVNPFSLKVFNHVYYFLNKRKKGCGITYYQDFFYPLDKLVDWNRIYGPKGFYQYQIVVPRQNGKEVITCLLKLIARAGEGSFLSVLKTFSKEQSLGMLSFPKEGVTLALDFPNRAQSTLALFERLDAVVREAQGRVYLAKDARMSRDLFESTYPRYQEFLTYRDPGISSAMSRRLMGF